jgi:PAS domain S-box-containing protein
MENLSLTACVAGKSRVLDRMLRRAEADSQESMRLFRTLIDAIPDLVWLRDPDGRFRLCNTRMQFCLGIPEEEILGRSLFSTLDPETAASCRDQDLKVLACGKPQFYERQITFACDGHRETNEVIKVPYLGADGNLLGVLGVGRDISRRKHIETDLLRSHAEMTAILESTNDLIWSVDGDFALVTFNPSFARHLKAHYGADAKVGERLPDLLPAELGAIWSHHFSKAMAEDPFRLEYRSPEGTTLELSLNPVVLDGSTVGVSVFGKDISERKSSEETLRESERQFQDLFEHMLTGVIVADVIQAADGRPEGWRLVKANAAAEALSGLPLKQWIGEAFANTTLLQEQEVRDLYAVALEGKVLDFSQYNEKIKRHFEVRAYSPRRGQFAMMFHDVTEKRRAAEEKDLLQAQLEHSQRMEATGRLAGGIAHDFNNMLAVILMSTEMGLLQSENDTEAGVAFGHIRTAALHSADLTKQLLAFARRQPISPKTIDLNEAIEKALKMLRRIISEEIEIVWRPSPGDWKVWLDPTQLDQLFANLLVNARDAIGRQGTITIRTGNLHLGEGETAESAKAQPGEYVTFSVSDDGCGMSPDVQAQIFEPFYTTKALGQGTGLGLATVYGVVRQNKGFIRVESVVGQGTTFHIHFPRYQDATVASQAKAPEGPTGGRPGETVLVVEDNVDFLETVHTLLEVLGYQVLSTSRPEEVMDLVAAHRHSISIVLSDVTMPGMDGFTLAKQVHAEHPDLKFLFMSGYPANGIGKRCMNQQDYELIQKPFTLSDFAKRLRVVLDSRPSVEVQHPVLPG